MKPTTKKENHDLTDLYDKIYNERMNMIREQDEPSEGDNVAKSVRIKAAVKELEDTGDDVPSELQMADKEADKELKDTISDLKSTNG